MSGETGTLYKVNVDEMACAAGKDSHAQRFLLLCGGYGHLLGSKVPDVLNITRPDVLNITQPDVLNITRPESREHKVIEMGQDRVPIEAIHCDVNKEHEYWHKYLTYFERGLAHEAYSTLGSVDVEPVLVPVSASLSADEERILGSGLCTFGQLEPESLGKRPREDEAAPLAARSLFVVQQFQANFPCEDLQVAFCLESIKAQCFLVIDGHGGTTCAKMISYYFPRIFARRAAFFSSERYKTMAVAMDSSYEPAQVPSKSEAAALVHGSFLELEAILLATSQGKPKSSYSGACVACLVKFGSYCVVASVGDSVVSLVSKDRTTGEIVCTQINDEHVPTLQDEAVRVRRSLDLRDHVPFRPSMTAIIEKARKEMPARIDICQATAQTLLQRTRHFAHATGYREEGACSEQDKRIVCDALGLPSDFLDSIPLRLQGCYMMTRAMGDAHMKDKDCCGTEMHLVGTSLLGVPSVYHYDCCLDQDVAIVLATDGVTSGVFASQFGKSFGKAETLGDNAASMIVTGAIREALRRSKLSYAQLKMLTRGVARRSVIDDTTCLVVYFDDACSLLQ